VAGSDFWQHWAQSTFVQCGVLLLLFCSLHPPSFCVRCHSFAFLSARQPECVGVVFVDVFVVKWGAILVAVRAGQLVLLAAVFSLRKLLTVFFYFDEVSWSHQIQSVAANERSRLGSASLPLSLAWFFG